MESEVTPSIYVASLASYNNSILHGVWIELSGKTEEEVWEEIQSMLAACPEFGEEHAIHDFEGFGEIRISEHASISSVVRIAELLETHGEAFAVAYKNFEDVDQAEEAVKVNYQGCHKSLSEWAEDFAAETGLLSSVPEILRGYFDFERYARETEVGGTIWSANGSEGVHVFWVG
jgi:antirestriction protein